MNYPYITKANIATYRDNIDNVNKNIKERSDKFTTQAVSVMHSITAKNNYDQVAPLLLELGIIIKHIETELDIMNEFVRIATAQYQSELNE